MDHLRLRADPSNGRNSLKTRGSFWQKIKAPAQIPAALTPNLFRITKGAQIVMRMAGDARSGWCEEIGTCR